MRPIILLTGKQGQVGWELTRTLAPLGQVISLGRDDCDLSNPQAIRALVQAVKPNIIVNPAAYTAVDKAETEQELAFAVNATAPAIFAEEAKKLGASLIHYSTDYVFDGTQTTPYTEDTPTNPLNVYGASKLAGEQAILASGADAIILRTTWVYGNRGNNFLRTILRLAANKPELKIIADQLGAPTWSRMLAEATAAIIAKQAGKPFAEKAGIYHLSAAGQTSWHGFAQAIVKNALDAKQTLALDTNDIHAIPATDYPLPAPRPAYSTLNNQKIAEAFGIYLPNWQDTLLNCMSPE